MKRILKIVGIVVLLLVILLATAPFLFKGSLEDLLKKNINENLNAQVSWESLDLSLFKSFPNASLTLKDFSVINNAPFNGDTLASGETLSLDMKITELFKGEGEPISINKLFLDKAFINIQVNEAGIANYDIAIEQEETGIDNTAHSNTESTFSFALKEYAIENTIVQYNDQKANTSFLVENLSHSGSGDLSAKQTTLSTTSIATVAYTQGETKYLENILLSLEADIELDLENGRYTFKENEAKINELPLNFNGFVQVNENSNEIDLSFKTPSSDFKNFLAVMPKAYVKNIADVSTTGDFKLEGSLKGIVDDTYIPKMDILVESNNASFKYPDLPKTVRNISLNARLKNDTGIADDTYLNIGGVTFKIDEELFNASGSIKNLTKNALINLAIKGTLDLAKIDQVLPLDLEQELSGIFKADVTTNFDMNSIEKEQYQNIQSNGTASLNNFTYNDEAFASELKIEKADVNLTPENIALNEFKATTGQTDVSATGTIQNLIPWVMAKQDLKGNFVVVSNTFKVGDFMASEETSVNNSSKNEGTSTSEATEEAIKIPDFLDASLDFTAKKVLYDNLTLNNASGTVKIKDEAASLQNVKSDLFGGNIKLSGNVSTQNDLPAFAMNLDLQNIDIDESFSSLELLKYIAPIAKALDGNINTTLNLQGNLNENLTPILSSIAGDALAQILTAEVNESQAPLLSKLGEQVTFLDLDKLSLKDVSTVLTFKDGKIAVQPFDFMVKGVKVTAAGSHGLDKTIDYNLTMDVPAKMLGGDINKLLRKLDPAEADKMSVALPVALSGSFTSPKVTLDSKSAVNALTQRIIEKQKQDLLDKGTGILDDLLGGKDKPKDSTTTQTGNTNTTTEEIVKDVFDNIFGKKKRKKDSVKN